MAYGGDFFRALGRIVSTAADFGLQAAVNVVRSSTLAIALSDWGELINRAATFIGILGNDPNVPADRALREEQIRRGLTDPQDMITIQGLATHDTGFVDRNGNPILSFRTAEYEVQPGDTIADIQQGLQDIVDAWNNKYRGGDYTLTVPFWRYF